MSDEDVAVHEVQQQPAPPPPPQPIVVVAAAAAEPGAQQPAHAAELRNPSRQLDHSPQQEIGEPSSSATDNHNHSNSDSDDDDGYAESEYLSQSFVNNIFSSAESGFAIVIYKLLSNVEDDDTKASILKQVRLCGHIIIIMYKGSESCVVVWMGVVDVCALCWDLVDATWLL